MAQQGYILLNRSIQDNWLWQEYPFSYGQAWIDLLMLANFEDYKTAYKGEIIICKRGDVNYSISYLANRWKWDRKTVRKFLSLLESDGMCITKCTTHRTTITIVNYDVYQFSRTTKGATNCTTKSQQDGQQSPTNKERNKVNKEKENIKRKTSSKFNDIIHTEYDIDDIEKKILGGN